MPLMALSRFSTESVCTRVVEAITSGKVASILFGRPAEAVQTMLNALAAARRSVRVAPPEPRRL